MALNVVIMAAGKGTRMKSALPKVLHRVGGHSLLQHVLDAAAGLGAAHTVLITGHGADEGEAAVADSGATSVRQMPLASSRGPTGRPRASNPHSVGARPISCRPRIRFTHGTSRAT